MAYAHAHPHPHREHLLHWIESIGWDGWITLIMIAAMVALAFAGPTGYPIEELMTDAHLVP